VLPLLWGSNSREKTQYFRKEENKKPRAENMCQNRQHKPHGAFFWGGMKAPHSTELVMERKKDP